MTGRPCPECGGTGFVQAWPDFDPETFDDVEQAGLDELERCSACDGSGIADHNEQRDEEVEPKPMRRSGPLPPGRAPISPQDVLGEEPEEPD
jgi:hypothetical protein